MAKRIRYTKNGQPYIIKADGRARFIRGKRNKNTRRTGVRTMAKKSYSRKSGSKNYGLVGTIASAAIYGAFRQKASDALSPLTNKIPLGNISDEVGLGIAAILAKKYFGKKVPMLGKVCDAALVIESARIGEAAITGQLGGMSASTSSSNQVSNY